MTPARSPAAPPGRYTDWGTEVEVLPGGKIVLAGTPYLAGSGVFTDVCVGGAVRGGVTLAEAIDMASVRPRELFGLAVPDEQSGGPMAAFAWDGAQIRVSRTVDAAKTR